jgi:GNAT superfamily N-acetyltransferase
MANSLARLRHWWCPGSVELTWLDPDQLDPHDVAGAVAVHEAARVVDTPQMPPSTTTHFVAVLRHGWDGDRPITAVAREDGAIVGVLSIELPAWDNTHLGFVDVTVDPIARRRGLGHVLFETGVDRVRAEQRSLLLSGCSEGTPGEKFLETTGFERASAEVVRRQDPRTVDWARLDRQYAEAEARSVDYELVRLPGATPADLLDDMVRLTESINDAPTDDLDIEDEVFSADRIRRMEVGQRDRGRRLYRVVARHRTTGELAGHTLTAVEIEQPWVGWQLDTSVARDHRGHRLGLLLKTAMLHWMRDEEPQLRSVITWNAASNAHMIRVNELLGYTPIRNDISWQRRL